MLELTNGMCVVQTLKRKRNVNMKKIVFLIIGFVGLALGAIGAMVPLLPAFPFLLMAALGFGKRSEKLDRWFKETKLYKHNLESFVKGQGMTKATKIRVITTVTILMAISFVLMMNVRAGQIALFCVWIFHIVYFIFFVKTKLEYDEKERQ